MPFPTQSTTFTFTQGTLAIGLLVRVGEVKWGEVRWGEVSTHYLTELQMEQVKCQGAWLLCSEIHQHFCSQSSVPLAVQSWMSTGGTGRQPHPWGTHGGSGGQVCSRTWGIFLRQHFSLGRFHPTFPSRRVYHCSLAGFSVFLGFFPSSLTGISPNKILACLFLSWWLLPKAPMCSL